MSLLIWNNFCFDIGMIIGKLSSSYSYICIVDSEKCMVTINGKRKNIIPSFEGTKCT